MESVKKGAGVKKANSIENMGNIKRYLVVGYLTGILTQKFCTGIDKSIGPITIALNAALSIPFTVAFNGETLH